MGEAETLNPIFTEFTTTKAIWLGVIVICMAAVLFRGQRRRRQEAEAQRNAAERREESD